MTRKARKAVVLTVAGILFAAVFFALGYFMPAPGAQNWLSGIQAAAVATGIIALLAFILGAMHFSLNWIDKGEE